MHRHILPIARKPYALNWLPERLIQAAMSTREDAETNNRPGEARRMTMQEITPIAVRPWTLNGISERMIVSHYENNYGEAVRTLNAIRADLTALDARTPGYRVRALKREEGIAIGSVTLHELYFGNLGGQGNQIPEQIRVVLEEHFGSAGAWRREFVDAARSLSGGSGWMLFTYSRRDRRFWNQIATDYSQAAIDA